MMMITMLLLLGRDTAPTPTPSPPPPLLSGSFAWLDVWLASLGRLGSFREIYRTLHHPLYNGGRKWDVLWYFNFFVYPSLGLADQSVLYNSKISFLFYTRLPFRLKRKHLDIRVSE